MGQTHKQEEKYLWMSGGEIGTRVGQGREQSNLGTMQVREGQVKAKERSSNIATLKIVALVK